MQIVKAGYAGDNVPRVQFPSLVGRPLLRAEEDYVGDIALKVRFYFIKLDDRIYQLVMSVINQ